MKKLWLCVVLLVVACSSVEPLYMQNGVQVYRATCNGLARDIGDCYALASKQCAGNFKVIDSLEERGTTIYDHSGGKRTARDRYREQAPSGIAFKAQTVNRSMFFYCK